MWRLSYQSTNLIDKPWQFTLQNCREASAIAPRNIAPSLIWICKTQWWHSLFSFLTGNTLFEQIWSKKVKLPV